MQRYRVRGSGCIVRESIELDSRQVIELAPRTEVIVVTDSEGQPQKSPCGKIRVALEMPVKGWVTESRLEPYGTGHAVPRILSKPETSSCRRRKIKIRSKSSMIEQKPYKMEDPYERWVWEEMNGRNPAEPDVRSAYALALAQKGELEEAGRLLERVARDAPSCAEVRQALGWLETERKARESRDLSGAERLKSWADRQAVKRNWRSAATAYEQVLSQSDRELDRSRLCANVSMCYAKMKKWAEAERYARQAIVHNPAWPKARLRLVAALEGAGQLVEALSVLREARLPAKRLEQQCESRERRSMATADNETRVFEMRAIDEELREVEDLAGDDAEADEYNDFAPPEVRNKMRDAKRRDRDAKRLLRTEIDRPEIESESSVSEDDEGSDSDMEENNRRLRLEAYGAAKRAKAADAKRLAASTLLNAPTIIKHNMLDATHAGRGIEISPDGLLATQTSTFATAVLARHAFEPTGVQLWCFLLERRGEPIFGVCEAGVTKSSLSTSEGAWVIVCARTETRIVSQGRVAQHKLRPIKDGQTIGFAWDAAAGRLDLYVNGTLRRADLFGKVPATRELFAVVGFEKTAEPRIAAEPPGICRFIPGQIDDLKGRDAIKKTKNFALVDADGRPHPRRLSPKHPLKLTVVHQHGNGAPDAVWCETQQARWTQSVEKIELLAIKAPRSGLSAIDCDVELKVRYVRVSHRVTGEVWLEGILAHDIVPDESLWYVDDDGLLQIVLAKSLAQLHASPFVGDAKWDRLFEEDDPLSDADMDDDRTDLPKDRKRLEELSQLRTSQQAKFEVAKRERVEQAGKSWTWVNTDDKDEPIAPSYMVPDQIGYDVACDRHLVLKQAGCLKGA